MLDHISPHLPQRKVLIEPFVGAGAVFLNHDYEQYWVNDINPDLINLYQTIKRMGPKFIAEAQKWFVPANNKEKKYYALRDRFNTTSDKEEKAFLFLLLNRTGYNGLCRYNQKGQYNVPFGRYKQPYFPEKELLAFLEVASRVKFYNKDYTFMMKKAASLGDQGVVYCDPPYAPLTKTANFTSYAQRPFPILYQEKLGQLAEGLAQKGSYVVVSNHDLPFTREIYQNAQIVTLKASRLISCRKDQRRKVKELLAIFASK